MSLQEILTEEPKEGFLNYSLDKSKVNFNFDEEKAKSKLEGILFQPMLPSEREKIEKQVILYGGCWFERRVNERYAQLDPLIFSINRAIKFNSDQIIFPTIFDAELGSKEDFVTYRSRGGKYGNDYDVKAEIPSIPREALVERWKMVSYMGQLIAEAFKDPLMSRIIQEYPCVIERELNGKFKVIWAPDKVEIGKVAPVPGDPAIVYDRPETESLPRTVHLIYKWDIEGERDITYLLTDFVRSFPERQANKEGAE